MGRGGCSLAQMSTLETAQTLAAVRKQIAPAADADRVRLTDCHRCGKQFTQQPGKYKQLCADCAVDNQVSYAEQMRNREGPLYDRTVLAQLRHWTAEAHRRGLTPTADTAGDAQ